MTDPTSQPTSEPTSEPATQPTSRPAPEPQAVPAEAGPDQHGRASTGQASTGQAPPPDPRGSTPATLPYIKRAPSRRAYDLLLLVPFICVGTSIGTLAHSEGLLRHLGLVVAIGVLFAWIRAGLATEKAVHARWLLVMGGLAVVFVACGLLSKLA